MPWMKVSDDLPSKAETTRIPRAHRRSALGVWVLAGSWSAQQLTDGHVPEHMLDELSGTPSDAEWLVKAGFWAVVDDGWQFVEWAPDQPLREVVLEQRRKSAEKVKNWRSKNRPSNPASNPVTNSATNPVSNAGVTLPPSLSPTRPDPTASSDELGDAHSGDARSSVEAEFEEFWQVYPRKQARAEAAKAFKAVRKTVAQKTILDGVQAYALLNLGTDKTFLKLPAGWLRGERWDDVQLHQGMASIHTPEQRLFATTRPFIDERSVVQMPPRASEVTGLCSLHTEYPLPCDRCREEHRESGVA